MHRFITLLSVLAIIVEMYAISPTTRLLLSSGGVQSPLSRNDSDAEVDSVAPYYPLILQIDDAATVDSLKAFGVIVYKNRGDLYLTSVPRDSISQVLGLEGLVDAEALGEASISMDMARPFGSVDAVQDAHAPLLTNYDGRGVVTGFSDIGFDAQHIAFKDRIMGIHNYDSRYALVQGATTEAEIRAWSTDDSLRTHATHVGNILAGGYKGNGYYGVAPAADIVATTSRLYDVGILSGVEDIIAYAKAQGRPAVINLSLSSNLGAHDGTSLVCQYLERCSHDAIICISAGNAGDVRCYSQLDLAKGMPRVFVNTLRRFNGFDVNGITEVWSDSDVPFEICVEVYNNDTSEVVLSLPWTSGESLLEITPEAFPEWAEYMSGVVRVATGWSPANGRFSAAVSYDTHTEETSDRGPWSVYYTCIAVRQCAEQPAPHVDFFCDASSSYINAPKGAPNRVSADCSINNLTTARGVICVGMAISRTSAPNIAGEAFEWTGEVGNVSKYSSYNVAPGIAPLPDICAPGYYVVSALSSEYYALCPDSKVSAVATVDGKDYYWYPECGTSMASPFMAGVIALWLQADPTLTVDDVLDIACSTARRDYPDITDPRWGAGCVDAFAGIKEVIARDALSSVEMPYTISLGADRRLVLTGIDAADVLLFDLSGVKIDPASALLPGVYVISAHGASPTKLMVR